MLKTLLKKLIPEAVRARTRPGYASPPLAHEARPIRSPVAPIKARTARRDRRYGSEVTFSQLVENIGALDHAVSYFTIVPKDGPSSLCVREDQATAMAEALVAVAVYADLDLFYLRDHEQVRVVHHSEILQDVAAHPVTVFTLAMDGQYLTFRLERWSVEDDVLIAPRANHVTRKIYLETASAKRFLSSSGQNLEQLYDAPLAEVCTLDIDVVYTWVNSHDEDWKQLLAQHSEPSGPADAASEGDIDKDRFENRDELKYSLRSLFKYAPWVRHVYIVSNCAPPDWFDTANPKVSWVYHDAIIEPEYLPTFSSHAIESAIHKVPGLGEHYLYFNDDIFLVKPLKKSDFFTASGLAKIRLETYGMVHGELRAQDPDYLNAARNGQKLLTGHFGKVPTKLHTHSPSSAIRSVVETCEQTFEDHYQKTRARKFRSIEDISPTSFLYPHFAYLSGRGVIDFETAKIINSRGTYQTTLDNYSDLVLSRAYDELPLCLCINDGGGSGSDAAWGDAVVNFMTVTYTDHSSAEKAPLD